MASFRTSAEEGQRWEFESIPGRVESNRKHALANGRQNARHSDNPKSTRLTPHSPFHMPSRKVVSRSTSH